MRKPHALAMLVAMSFTPWSLAQAPAAQSAPAANSTPAAQARAATPAAIPTDQQATREQMKKLFEVLRMREQFDRVMSMMSASMEQAVRQGMEQALAQVPAAQQLNGDQQSQLEGIMSKYMKKAMNVYSADEMIEDATAVYQRHMTRSDVDTYIAFYSSPAGQRFLDAQPVITREYMPIVVKKAQDRSKQLDSEMTQEIVNFVKAQKPQAAPAKPGK